jgi:DNA-binding NarL/FixJ family response regulator
VHGIADSYNRDIAAFRRLEAAGERHLPLPDVATSIALEVLVADSSRMQAQLLAGALRRHADLHITSCLMNPASILQSAAERNPKVALLSFSAPANFADEIGTLRGFHLSHPGIAKIILADCSSREMVIHGFRSGARGILSVTDCNLRMLWKCILRVAAGQIWLNTEQLNWLVELISETPSLRVLNAAGRSLLTPREEQVVALVAEGLSNREIAIELTLSEHTIKKYLFRVFEKLGISSRVELVLYALHHGQPRTAEWLPAAAALPG